MLTLAKIDRRGWHLKSWTLRTGQFRVGNRFELNSLHRMLTNLLYTGAIVHKGQPYPGEHAAILAPGVYERVQSLMKKREAFARGRARNKHLALLGGLLYCDCCATRMVYTYAQRANRKYPYYLCLNARRNGRAACPGKLLPAFAIEESALGRVREAQPGSFEATGWDRMDRTVQVQLLQAAVERVGYNGAAQQISIRFCAEISDVAVQEMRA